MENYNNDSYKYISQMKRRQFVSGTIATGLAAGLAGCLPDAERVEELPRPRKGPEDADVVIQVFEDYSCPACQQFNQNVEPSIEDEYLGEESVAFEHFDWPIPVHPRWSYEMANAARGVQDRLGDEEFFTFRDAIFEQADEITTDIIEEEAESVGVEELDVFMNDASASLYRPVIQSDKTTGEERGVTATPGVFVNGELQSSPSFEVISSSIDNEL